MVFGVEEERFETRRAVQFEEMLCDSNVKSEELVKFVDDNFSHPGLRHFNAHQTIWIRDREWFMGEEQGKRVHTRDAVEDYENNFAGKFHRFYWRRYIAPCLNSAEKRGELEEEEKKWIEAQARYGV